MPVGREVLRSSDNLTEPLRFCPRLAEHWWETEGFGGMAMEVFSFVVMCCLTQSIQPQLTVPFRTNVSTMVVMLSARLHQHAPALPTSQLRPPRLPPSLGLLQPLQPPRSIETPRLPLPLELFAALTRPSCHFIFR